MWKLRRRSGQSAVEYAILLGLLAAALLFVATRISAGTQRMGTSAEGTMNRAADALDNLQ